MTAGDPKYACGVCLRPRPTIEMQERNEYPLNRCGMAGAYDGSCGADAVAAGREARRGESLVDVREMVTQFYWHLYSMGIGSRCHAFLEFVGVMSKYLDVVRDLEAQGVPPYLLSGHTGQRVIVHDHHMEYLAEKLGCILRPIIESDPRARETFRVALFGGSK